MNKQPVRTSPPPRGMRFGPKPKNAKKAFKRILSYMFIDYKVQFIIVIIGTILGVAVSLINTYFLKYLTDELITPLIGEINPDYTKFIIALFVMIGLYLTAIITNHICNRLMINVSQGTLKKIRDDLFSHMEKLPIKYFDQNTHGDLMSRYTNDVDTLRQMISQSITQIISSSITLVGAFVMMVLLSWQLTLIAIFMIFIVVKVIKVIGGKSRKYFMERQSRIGKTNGFIEEMIEGEKVIKVFCHEEEAIKNFDKLNEELCTSSTNANIYANVLMPIINNIGNINYVLIALVGAVFTYFGLMDATIITWGVGSLISFMQYSRSFSQPITQVSQQFNSIIMALAGAERIFNVIDEPIEVDEGYVTLVNAKYNEFNELVESSERTGIWAWKHPHHDGSLTYQRLTGAVTFNDVDFGYHDDHIVLHNISLYANPGQKIAFVGSTGAGKTTITNLINRFYDVQDGKIRYDDININKIKKADLRRSLGMVLQDTHLFTGTVKENIRYGRLDATDEEVIEAAKLANADYFISHLPNGYDTILTSDGSNLSQGQRQLLSIARAMIADTPVLILDEATSSIDTRTELLIEKGMDKLMEGRTVFVIAHRLSTVRNSHAIMVLENGQIIERGNHSQLLEQKGKYYQLYTGTFELS